MNEPLTLQLNRLVASMREHAETIVQDRLGINFSTARVLMILNLHGTISQTHMAECLGLTPAAVSKFLPGIVQAGLVKIEPDPKQPRRNFINLLPKGHHLALESSRILEEEFVQMVHEQGVDADRLSHDLAAIHAGLNLPRTKTKEVFGFLSGVKS